MTTDRQRTTESSEEEALVLPPPRAKPQLSRLTASLGLALVLAAAFYGGVRAQQAWGDDSTGVATGAVAKVGAKDAGSAEKAVGAAKDDGSGTAESKAAGKAGFAQGEVTAVSGRTLFVANWDGAIVAVEVPTDAKLTRADAVTFVEIRPGDTVSVTGAPGKSGSIQASSVTVGSGVGAAAKAKVGAKPAK